MPNTTSALSPRRLTHSLPAAKKAPPSPTTPSLSHQLWEAATDLAQAALDSEYIQGIKNGTLNPNFYGQYSVQDVAYCHSGLEDWRAVAARASHEDVKAFADARVKSWASYTQETYADWHITDPTAVKLAPVVQAYADFESDVTHNYDPLYAVVVMIPCDRLWYWLATQLQSHAVETNLYKFWIDENGGSDSGAQHLEAFVDAHVDALDKATATKVYRTAMLGEVNFFRSVCKQKPLQIPAD